MGRNKVNWLQLAINNSHGVSLLCFFFRKEDVGSFLCTCQGQDSVFIVFLCGRDIRDRTVTWVTCLCTYQSQVFVRQLWMVN